MKKAFTLMELVVVVAIIAVLAVIVFVNSFKAIEKGKISGIAADYRTIKTAAISYFSDTANWPSDGNAAASLVSNDNSFGWRGPYLDNWPQRDPWGGVYRWRNDNAGAMTFGSGVNERYLEATSVPSGSALRIDSGFDDGNVTNGLIRYDAGTGTLRFAVSDDSF